MPDGVGWAFSANLGRHSHRSGGQETSAVRIADDSRSAAPPILPIGLGKGRGGKPLNQFWQHSAVGVLHCDNHHYCAAGDFTGNEGAGDHSSVSGCEVNRTREHDYVQFMVAVASWRDITRTDHGLAARFA